MTRLDVLVVCVGNLCRSPLAERLLRDHLAAAGLGDAVRVTSAGLEAPVGAPMDAHATVELVRLGGDPAGFASRRLTPAMLAEADLVLTATRDLRARAVALHPRALRRAFTLRELAALCREGLDAAPGRAPAELVLEAARHRQRVAGLDLDLTDPVGRPPAVHRAVADVVGRDVEAIVAHLLIPSLAGSPGPTAHAPA